MELALVEAAEAGDYETLKHIAVEDPYLLGINNEKGTVAFISTKFKNLECLKIAAEFAPASVGLPCIGGATPAIMAAQEGLTEFLKIIINAAPASLETPSNSGATPASVAAEFGHAQCLKLIAEIAPHTLNSQRPALFAAQNGYIEEVIAKPLAHPDFFCEGLAKNWDKK